LAKPLPLAESAAVAGELAKCVNCGLCQSVCPTYIVDGHEGKTARGKIELMKGMLSGRVTPSSSIADLFDDCLTCYACQSVCPAGVRTEALWTAARQDLAPIASTRSRKHRLLKFTVGSPALLNVTARLGGFAAGFSRKHPERARLGRFGLPLFRGAPYLPRLPDVVEPEGETIGTVGLLLGCSTNFSAPWAADAAISLLTRAGWRVVIPHTQGCCGAPAINNGEWPLARKLAQRTIALFSDPSFDRITSPDATCLSAIKSDYGHIFAGCDDKPEDLSILQGKTRQLGNIVADAAYGRQLNFGRVRAKVTIHDSCHATHLGEPARWREVLARVQGLELIEMEASRHCCGFGGSYALFHREVSTRIAGRKMDQARATGAATLLVGSPGCQIRLQSLEGERLEVRYAGEFLAATIV